jgi:receptor protein-tyrosine kinase
MTFSALLAALRASWWLLVVALLAGGGAALGTSSVQTPLYSSTTQLFVSTSDIKSTTDVYQGSQFSEQRVTSYVRLLTGAGLARRVIHRLDLPLTAEELHSEIRASAAPDTVLIDVTVTDPSAARAQGIANALVDEFADLVADLETPAGGGPSPVKVSVTEAADLPTAPSSPRTLLNTVGGALAGLLVGSALAVGRVRLDRSVKNSDEAADLAGVPVIGAVLRDQGLEERHTIDRQRFSRTAEDYRQLRTNLQFLSVDEPPKVIMVSSAVPAEGKTTVVVNLALALVEAGQRVTIVEADLRRPKVIRYLGLVGGVGLTNVLAGNASFDEVTQAHDDGGLFVIGAGPTPPNPGELLSSSHMSALLDKLRGLNDYVLVDAPPLLPVADASGLAVLVDGVLLSVRYGRTRKEQLRQAATLLERVSARTLGLILNIVPPKAGVAAAYGYGYGYGYGREAERADGDLVRPENRGLTGRRAHTRRHES